MISSTMSHFSAYEQQSLSKVGVYISITKFIFVHDDIDTAPLFVGTRLRTIKKKFVIPNKEIIVRSKNKNHFCAAGR